MTGNYDGRGTIGLPIEELQSVIRDMPKPVIARVNGFAIGGGNVLVTCATSRSRPTRRIFGQVGPKVGSVDPGFGTAYLARVVGREEGARDLVPVPALHGGSRRLTWGSSTRWSARPNSMPRSTAGAPNPVATSPTALALAKRSFNADTESILRYRQHGHGRAQPLLRHRKV